MMEFDIYGIGLIPVIMALVELAKRAGLANQWLPMLSILLGIGAGFGYLAPGDPLKAIFLGIVVGLMGVGLFSGTKNTLGK